VQQLSRRRHRCGPVLVRSRSFAAHRHLAVLRRALQYQGVVEPARGLPERDDVDESSPLGSAQPALVEQGLLLLLLQLQLQQVR